ncbi:hypothetical protein J2R87_005477 [Bradyrhizobium elkanii]|nr:hypothetical protein [Bradyrhizobium elkanii]MCS4106757.1 hypothetical protein [Bradyrhizobium elkanii]
MRRRPWTRSPFGLNRHNQLKRVMKACLQGLLAYSRLRFFRPCLRWPMVAQITSRAPAFPW